MSIHTMFSDAARQLEHGSAFRLFTFNRANPSHRLIYPFWMVRDTSSNSKPIIVLEMAYSQIVFASRLLIDGRATDLCCEKEDRLQADPVLLDPREVLATDSKVLKNLFSHCEPRFRRDVIREAIRANEDLERAAVARIASAVLDGDTSAIFV